MRVRSLISLNSLKDIFLPNIREQIDGNPWTCTVICLLFDYAWLEGCGLTPTPPRVASVGSRRGSSGRDQVEGRGRVEREGLDGGQRPHVPHVPHVKAASAEKKKKKGPDCCQIVSLWWVGLPGSKDPNSLTGRAGGGVFIASRRVAVAYGERSSSLTSD